jgi:hypothetical protein
MSSTDLTVANTILAQLGGAGRLRAMIGADNFVGSADSLQLKFKSRATNGANTLRVRLGTDDTYTVEFWKVRGVSVSKLSERSDVYVANLRAVFERETGLYLSL